jgi:hypothetical protein
LTWQYERILSDPTSFRPIIDESGKGDVEKKGGEQLVFVIGRWEGRERERLVQGKDWGSWDKRVSHTRRGRWVISYAFLDNLRSSTSSTRRFITVTRTILQTHPSNFVTNVSCTLFPSGQLCVASNGVNTAFRCTMVCHRSGAKSPWYLSLHIRVHGRDDRAPEPEYLLFPLTSQPFPPPIVP